MYNVKINFIIIDDHPIFRKGLAALIENEENYKVVYETDDPLQALERIRLSNIDFVVTDISFKDESGGIDLIKEIRALDQDICILVISMYDENLFAPRILDRGANGYVMKTESGESVTGAIKTILAGKIFISRDLEEQFLFNIVQGVSHCVQDPVNCLTDKEFEVFRLIGRGFKPSQIADRLKLQPGTVETYRKKMKKKLMMKNAFELRQYAIQWRRNNFLS